MSSPEAAEDKDKGEEIIYSIPENTDAADSDLTPPGDFPLVKPLDLQNYPDTPEDQKIIFEKTARDLLGSHRFKARNNPYKMMKALDMKKGMNLADIGCGPGFYTFVFAYRIGFKRKDPRSGNIIVTPVDESLGIMYAVDNYRPTLDYTRLMKEHIKRELKVDFQNIVFICNDKDSLVNDIPPDSLDLAFLSEVHIYNHIPKNPRDSVLPDEKKKKEFYFNLLKKNTQDFTASVHRALKDGGVFVITESDVQDNKTQSIIFGKDVAKILEDTGMFRYKDTLDIFPGAYVLLMKKEKK